MDIEGSEKFLGFQGILEINSFINTFSYCHKLNYHNATGVKILNFAH